MDNTSEIEKLKLDIASIDEFLKESRAYIEAAMKDIMDVGKYENSLRLLYPDVCELDELRNKIESTQKMQEEVEGGDDFGRSILEQRIQSLQKGLDLVVERLGKYGIQSMDDYNNMMEAVREKKEAIPNTKASIKKKEAEMLELEERKTTILSRIEALERENEIKIEDTNESKVQEDDQERNNADIQDDINPKDAQRKESSVSELAAFIDYQSDDGEVEEVEEKKVDTVVDDKKTEKKPTSRKKDSLDGAIEDVLQKQEKVNNKFLEIIQENREDDISEEILKFHEKFQEIVYKRLNDAIEKITNKRTFIEKLSEYAKEYTKDKEDERLNQLNNDVLDSIKSIEQDEQGFEGEIKYSFNEFNEYVNNEYNYLCTLKSRIEDQLTEISAKIDNIENELGEIKGNSKESMLELITDNQRDIDNAEKKLNNVYIDFKENMLQLMDNIKSRIGAAEDYDGIKAILENFSGDITEKEEEMDNNKASIEEEIGKLNERKKELEEKYNHKKETEASDMEREAFLLDSKKMLKDEVQKVVDMINMLETRNEDFKVKLSKDKRSIKNKIKKSDSDIVARKNELISKVNEDMKSYKLRLFENVEEYNNEYTKEFDRYATKVMSDIEDIKKENNEIKEKVHNVVVLSEFEENIPLLDNLKESLDKIILVDKMLKSVEKPEEEGATKIKQAIETSLSYLKPEDTIDNKIDFSAIYDIENDMQLAGELKEGVVSLCDRLEMDYESKEKKDRTTKKVVKRDKPQQQDNVPGLEGYDDDTREILMDMSWERIEELKNMNMMYNKSLYLEDLINIKEEKVMGIAKLKEDYKGALEMTRKLYDLKKYVLAYKKGMDELAKGAKSDDKEDQKEYNRFMKVATKSLKTMQENGISSFEDFRNKVMKNSENVKYILAKTKTENEELVKLTSLIKAIELAMDEHKESRDIVGVV